MYELTNTGAKALIGAGGDLVGQGIGGSVEIAQSPMGTAAIVYIAVAFVVLLLGMIFLFFRKRN